MNDAEAVKEFTESSTGKQCPTTPQEMTYDDVLFIVRMVFSEMCELICTVTNNEQERDELLHKALESIDQCTNFTYSNKNELIAAQNDALVDSWYYSLNTAAKHGVNLSSIFNLVHQANMDKRDPVTGKFIKRESDGKIIKPPGWKSPNIEEEIKRQSIDGSWEKK